MIRHCARKLALLSVTAITCLGVYGCMFHRKEAFSVDACVTYMQEKYGMDFVYTEPIDDFQPTASSLRIYVSAADAPDSRILVSALRNEDGSIRYLDNYVAVKYAPQTARVLTESAQAVYGTCRVIYSVNERTALADIFDAQMSFEEYAGQKRADINALLLLPPSHGTEQKDAEMDALAEQLKAHRIAARFAVCYVSDQQAYDSIQTSSDRYEWNRRGKWCETSGTLSVDGSFETDIHRWR